jgi:hypothetical protein
VVCCDPSSTFISTCVQQRHIVWKRGVVLTDLDEALALADAAVRVRDLRYAMTELAEEMPGPDIEAALKALDHMVEEVGTALVAVEEAVLR